MDASEVAPTIKKFLEFYMFTLCAPNHRTLLVCFAQASWSSDEFWCGVSSFLIKLFHCLKAGVDFFLCLWLLLLTRMQLLYLPVCRGLKSFIYITKNKLSSALSRWELELVAKAPVTSVFLC